jgi:hypothetical protein
MMWVLPGDPVPNGDEIKAAAKRLLPPSPPTSPPPK